MDRSDFSFHRSFEAQCHLDPRSFEQDSSDTECTWYIDGTSAPVLSQYSSIEPSMEGATPSLSMNFHNHTAFLAALDAAMYFAS